MSIFRLWMVEDPLPSDLIVIWCRDVETVVWIFLSSSIFYLTITLAIFKSGQVVHNENASLIQPSHLAIHPIVGKLRPQLRHEGQELDLNLAVEVNIAREKTDCSPRIYPKPLTVRRPVLWIPIIQHTKHFHKPAVNVTQSYQTLSLLQKSLSHVVLFSSQLDGSSLFAPVTPKQLLSPTSTLSRIPNFLTQSMPIRSSIITGN